jgi:hypothetical protein
MKKFLLFFIAFFASLSINATVRDSVKVSLKMPDTEKILFPSIDTLGTPFKVIDTIFWAGNGINTLIIDTLKQHPIDRYLTVNDLKKIGYNPTNFYIGSLFIGGDQVKTVLDNNTKNFPTGTPDFSNGSIDTLYLVKWFYPVTFSSDNLKFEGKTQRTQLLNIDEGESFKIGFTPNDISDVQFVKAYKNKTQEIYSKSYGKFPLKLDSIVYTPAYNNGITDSINVIAGNWSNTIEIESSNLLRYTVFKKYDFYARYIDSERTHKDVDKTTNTIILETNQLPIKLFILDNISLTDQARHGNVSDKEWLLKKASQTAISERLKQDTIEITEAGTYQYFFKYDGKEYSTIYEVKINTPIQTTYSLTVVNGFIITPNQEGKNYGKYLPNSIITVRPTIPATDEYFYKWTDDFNPQSAVYEDIYEYKMPATNVILTANFCNYPVYTFNDEPIPGNIITIHSLHDANILKVNGEPIWDLSKQIRDSIAYPNVPENFSITHKFISPCDKREFVETFEVTVSQKFVGNEEINDAVSVYAYGNTININVNEPTFVTIYSITGQVVKSETVSNETQIQLPAGLYIVKVNDKVTKVVIKN